MAEQETKKIEQESKATELKDDDLEKVVGGNWWCDNMHPSHKINNRLPTDQIKK